MKEELKKLLKKLGANDSTIEKLSQEEIDQEIINESFDQIHQTNRNIIENDADFISSIKSKVRGEVLSSKERKFSKLFGISQEEIDQLPEKTKFDSLMSLGFDKLKSNSNSTDEELKKKLNDKDAEILRLNNSTGIF